MSNDSAISKTQAVIACALIIAGTVLGLAGIDLVLPAVPSLPAIFDTDTATAQLVLALYVAGSSLGLLVFGSLAAHIGRRRLFIGSLATFAALSALATYADSIEMLIIVRLFQGAAASGAAVLAPGLIRSLFSELGSIRAIAAMGSIESLTPGLAPILGAWLFSAYDWTASFWITAILCAVLCSMMLLRPKMLPSIGTKTTDTKGSYSALFKNSTYLRYALSHGFVLGGLLVFVFTVPAVIVQTMGGTIDDFILMQIVGVSSFIIVSNFAGHFVKWFGVERVIMAGTVIAVLGSIGLLTYALIGRNDPTDLKLLFWLLNVGLGIRGGPGFVRALTAAGGDDDRGSALIILFITLTTALGTAAIAPFIPHGLIALTIAIILMELFALALMVFIAPIKVTDHNQLPT
ncbi:MFS transporter [Kordiimonas aquimaris]|uniref:MFS transporter n=1 Tax=Kordiimonas aquimaris TaxID=707591 RepID=UPI0021D01227|nr:MFS transporter [Kordiimonas aquimaris]